MADFELRDIGKIMQGRLLNMDKGLLIKHYEFDSRLVKEPNTLFFAFKSANNNGHDYIKTLINKEAVAAVVAEDFNNEGLKIPLIVVDDPLKSAQIFAKKIRLENKKTKFIAVTGSIGKTTTKEFCYQLLSFQWKVFKSYKNWNNWIGLPFSIMKMSGKEDFAIFELGMSEPGIGEIDSLSAILLPDISIVLNAYPVHLEFLKTLQNIAQAKMEVLNHLDPEGYGYINGDCKELVEIAQLRNKNIVYFGCDKKQNNIILTEVVRKAEGIEFTINYFNECENYQTRIINRIQIENLFVAVMLAKSLNMQNGDIQKAIDKIEPIEKRGKVFNKANFEIIDESYNSNPQALKKTLKWINDEYGAKRKIAVLGDMLELGVLEDDFHTSMGEYFATLSYSLLLVVGKRAKNIAKGAIFRGYEQNRILEFHSSKQAGRYLADSLDTNHQYLIVFKGSRGMKMEEGIEELMNG